MTQATLFLVQTKMRIIKIIAIALLALYVAACGFMYTKQKTMLFPAQYAQPVPTNWRAHSLQIRFANALVPTQISITKDI